MSEIVNRVAASPIMTIDLETFYRTEERIGFDLKEFLFQELVLREKEFRSDLNKIDWDQYKGKLVAIFCSADAIVPNWAFMLVGTFLSKSDVEFVIGGMNDLEQYLFERAISGVDPREYENRPVVIKGCSKYPVPLYAYGRIMAKIQPFAKSIMYGEPCSTVPLYKASK